MKIFVESVKPIQVLESLEPQPPMFTPIGTFVPKTEIKLRVVAETAFGMALLARSRKGHIEPTVSDESLMALLMEAEGVE